jgi:hypothetical protein
MFEPYLFGILFFLRTFTAPSLVQQIGPGLPETAFNQGAVRFAPQARAALYALWEESTTAHQERMACIRAYRYNGAIYVTNAKPAAFEYADSVRIKIDPSACGAPAWNGHAHTHIARFNGQPLVTFSTVDRMLMAWWRKTWKAEGLFCVLYSKSQAYCEYEASINADAIYSSTDPIEVMYYGSNQVRTGSSEW